ncbi:creatininase family protein, partial [Rosenbergiella collisarenosi]|uniref:creatininase family protein n=1 Tax=Rosenbergiella collisarenosi TaxID=1544695 RepID=UPI001F500AD2
VSESVYRAGFSKILMINGHGGQPQVLQMAAREMRLRHGDIIVIAHDVFNVPNNQMTFLTEKEHTLGMHAGQSETALMLALSPEHVRMD